MKCSKLFGLKGLLGRNKQMTIAITGASGFIGSSLVEKLADMGMPFVASTRKAISGPYFKPETWQTVDFGHESSLRNFCEGAECVIHLAGPDAETCSKSNSEIETFVEVTKTLFLAAVNSRVKRFIFVSTVHVYGDASDEVHFEEHHCRPTSSYGASRLRAEEALRELATFHETELVIVRLANTFGWNRDPNSSSWRLFVNELVKSGFETGALLIRGNPDSSRDFVPIEVVVSALQNLAGAPISENVGGTWNIGSGASLTLSEMAELIAASIARAKGLQPVIVIEDRNQSVPTKLRINTSKARRAGFIGEVSVSNGVDALVAQMLKSEQASNAL
mgnify:CR=1 FL=1